MPNIILAEHTVQNELTITLANLLSSTVGVGRQTTLITNTDLAQIVHIYVAITVNEAIAVTANTNIFIYLIKGDGTIRSDSAGASDNGWTQVNARLLGPIRVPVTTANVQYHGDFIVRNPGPEWGIGLVHDTGQELSNSEAASVIRYADENQEVQ